MTLLLIAVLLAPANLFAQAQEAKQAPNTLVIQAESEFAADPDLATLSFHVFAQDKLLQRAYQQADSATQRILQLAARSGLSPQEISAGTLRVIPIQDWSDKKIRIRSYRVETTIRLRVKDFARIAPLVDEAVQEGISELRSVDYTLEDEEDARQRAIAAAMRSAEARARVALRDNGRRRLGSLLAAAVDVTETLRPAITLPVNGRNYLDYLRLQSAGEPSTMGAAPTSTALPEKIRVRASVQCVFQLE